MFIANVIRVWGRDLLYTALQISGSTSAQKRIGKCVPKDSTCIASKDRRRVTFDFELVQDSWYISCTSPYFASSDSFKQGADHKPRAALSYYRAVGTGKKPVRPMDGGVARIVGPGWVRAVSSPIGVWGGAPEALQLYYFEVMKTPLNSTGY